MQPGTENISLIMELGLEMIGKCVENSRIDDAHMDGISALHSNTKRV